MKGLFHRIFCLYPGEGKNAFLFVCLAFFWAIGAYCGLTLTDGLFLEHMGAAALPKAYLSIALGLIFIASVFLYLLPHLNPYKLYLTILTLGGIGYLSIAFCFHPQANSHPSFWMAIKVFANIHYVVLTTCFWFFIDQYYNSQNAKRLYTLFNSAIFLGNACGAAWLSLSLNLLKISGLILTIVTLMMATAFWIAYIAKKVKSIADDYNDENRFGGKQSFKAFFKGVSVSRFTLLLMVTYFLIQILNITTEYNYMEGMARYFAQIEFSGAEGLVSNRLTIFLGKCSAWVALANVIFGLLFYSRIVSRFGVNNLLLVSPTFFLAIFMGWSFGHLLLFSVLGLIAVEGVSYALDENNSHLLLNAVPMELKNKVRIAIDSFFEPLGMFTSALILLLLDINSLFLGILLSAVTLIIVLDLRAQYRHAVFVNLTKNAVHFQRSARDWLTSLSKKQRRFAEFRLIASLRKLDEPLQLLAYEALLELRDPKVLPRLLNHLNSMSYRSKIKAIELLGKSVFCLEAQVLDRLNQWMRETTHPTLKSTIHFYFAKYGLLHPDKIIADLKSHDLLLRGAAILALKKSSLLFKLSEEEPPPMPPSLHGGQEWIDRLHKTWLAYPPVNIAFHHLQATALLDQLLQSPEVEEVTLALLILNYEGSCENVEKVLPFLKSPSLKIARQAARTMAALMDKNSLRHAPTLLHALSISNDNLYRLDCLRALGRIKDSSLVRPLILSCTHLRPNERRLAEEMICQMGLRTVPTLLAMTKDSQLHDRCRMLAGRILGRIALPQLRANLLEIITAEIERAYFYFYYSYALKKEGEEIPILKDALVSGYHSVIDSIIQLLGVAGSIENSELLVHGLRSKNPKIRGNAIETLEKTCETKIFLLLKPLIDDRPIEEKMRVYLKGNRPLLTFEELLDKLEGSASPLDRIVSLTLKARHDFPNWRTSLRRYLEKDEELFYHFAYELLEI